MTMGLPIRAAARPENGWAYAAPASPVQHVAEEVVLGGAVDELRMKS
jgi:hypothetical protein